ncbi:MAG: BON domain-containing protein [Kiritimatiellaeota bacterium]|nr:BON domain-containing protein [Kiritimatiellota bacterium]
MMKKRLCLWSLVGLLGLCLAGCTTAPSGADQSLKNEVLHRLNADDLIRREVVGVTVEQGVITLIGTVSDEALRLRAISIAQGITGVQKVEDRLLRK